MDQAGIGRFLRSLRKEKGKTQEEIAEIFGVSARSVSRWENGNTMPDVGILVELADYYDVDIREIIDGERKSETVEKETKETLLRVADYADSGKRRALSGKKAAIWICCGLILALSAAMTALVIGAFSRQYNARGISGRLCVSIDENRPREYIGQLDGYAVYTEGMDPDGLYFTTVDGKTVSLTEAVGKGLVSVRSWRRMAQDITEAAGAEILRYENYEIAVSDGECVIRPVTG
ncbi:MAG: helix-turn-helix transcriptional regulator [Oscillospiraceae bacterium]|nr:helix-turn-helix transcriptional regulator [Oscillospiraceae bacterium]